MATQSMHIVEYRTEPPPPAPPAQPSNVNNPVQAPEITQTLQARNEVDRSLGIGQTVDVIV